MTLQFLEELEDIRRRAGLPLLETNITTLNDAINLLAKAIASHGDEGDFDVENEEHTREELTSIAESILSKATQGKLRLYRMICLQGKSRVSKKHLGVSWSYYAGDAHCWNEEGEGSTKLLITALASPSSINWLETLYHNIHGDFYDEKEVRLHKNQPVTVESIAVQSGRSWNPYMEGFEGSTGSKFYSDAADRGADFVKWASKTPARSSQKSTTPSPSVDHFPFTPGSQYARGGK